MAISLGETNMITTKQIIETIETKIGKKIPMKGKLAGGAVANTIAYLSGVAKELVINDVDIFIHGDHSAEFYANGKERGYHNVPAIVSTSREGIFNYTVRTDANDIGRLIDSFDLNCTMAGINLETGFLYQNECFKTFIATKEIKVIRYHSPERTLARMVRKATELGVYYDRLQETALRAAFAAEADGTVNKYGEKMIFIQLEDLRMVYLRTFDVESYIKFATKYLKATKVQKRNIAAFTGGKTVGSVKTKFIKLLLGEKNMLPADQLAAASRIMFKEGHQHEVHASFVGQSSDSFKFHEWYQMISFCKKTRHQIAWSLLYSSRNLTHLRRQVAQKLRRARAKWSPMLLPTPIMSDGYIIHEITRERDLMNEGSEMGHCVGGYAGHCISQRTSIIAVKTPEGKRYTLSFDKAYGSSKEPVKYYLQQFKGRFNHKPEVEHYNKVLELIQKNCKYVDAVKKVSAHEHFRY